MKIKMKIPIFTFSLIIILAFLITYNMVQYIIKIENNRENLKPGIYPLTQESVMLEDMYKINKMDNWGEVPKMSSDRYVHRRILDNPDNGSCTPKNVCGLYE